MSHVEYVTLHNKINKNRSCANRNGRAMKHTPICFSIKHSEEIPKLQIYCIIFGTATQEKKSSQAVIFILIFTYIEEKGDIICQVKLNAVPFTSVCLPLNR